MFDRVRGVPWLEHGPWTFFTRPGLQTRLPLVPPPRFLKTYNSTTTVARTQFLHHQTKMSTPNRRQRDSQSATPRRANNNIRQSQSVSSPLFYESSPAPHPDDGANGDVSSPLRQMTNSQSTRGLSGIPSSPLRQMTDAQTDDDPQRTPRATPGFGGV